MLTRIMVSGLQHLVSNPEGVIFGSRKLPSRVANDSISTILRTRVVRYFQDLSATSYLQGVAVNMHCGRRTRKFVPRMYP
jgi:hypothetical protein